MDSGKNKPVRKVLSAENCLYCCRRTVPQILPKVEQDTDIDEQLNENERRQKIRHAVDEDGKNGIGGDLEDGNERAGTADLMNRNGVEGATLHQRTEKRTREIMEQNWD